MIEFLRDLKNIKYLLTSNSLPEHKRDRLQRKRRMRLPWARNPDASVHAQSELADRCPLILAHWLVQNFPLVLWNDGSQNRRLRLRVRNYGRLFSFCLLNFLIVSGTCKLARYQAPFLFANHKQLRHFRLQSSPRLEETGDTSSHEDTGKVLHASFFVLFPY